MAIVGVNRWRILDDVMLVCGTKGKPRDGEWEAFDQAMETAPVQGCLVLSLGTPDLTLEQRRKSATILRDRGIPVVVVSNDGVMRRLIGMAAWLGSNVSAFGWGDLLGALARLGVPEERADPLLAAMTELRSTVEREFANLNQR